MAIEKVFLIILLSLSLSLFSQITTSVIASQNPDPARFHDLSFAEYDLINSPLNGKFVEIHNFRINENDYSYLIVIEESLITPLHNEIEQYCVDLANENYSPLVLSYNGNSALQLKEEIITYYQDSAITGLLLMGDLPSAWFELYEDSRFNKSTGDRENSVDFICDLYFADIDGIWDDLDGNGVYDSHTGDVHPELEIGRIKADNLNLTDYNEIELLRNYLNRNHLYRINQLPTSDNALIYLDDDWHANANTYSQYFSALYNTITVVNSPNSTTASNYLNQHLSQPYEFIQLHAHSSSQSHSFHQNDHTEIDVVTNSQIAELNPQCLFYNLFCCSAGNFEADNCLASTYLLSNDYGLAVIASSKAGGMLYFNDMYSKLALDESFGSSFKNWWISNVDVDDDFQFQRSWFYGMMIMGDPTLRLYRESAITWHVNIESEIGGDGSISNPYNSIQVAIDCSSDGDEILVDDGVYHESVNFSGKILKIRSINGSENCIIDGDNERNCVILENDEPETCLLDGFTITNGNGGWTPATSGGAIRCFNDANPILKNLIVTENFSCNEAVYIGDSNPTLINCEIVSNSCVGIYMEYNSSPTLDNCKINDNRGGGIRSSHSPFQLYNCELAYNGANSLGGGIHLFDTNCFLYGVSIHHNQSGGGGGIYLEQSSVWFSDENRCSIYSNSATIGLDLYQNNCSGNCDVIVDTFTVYTPSNRFAYPITDYNFDILSAVVVPVSSDLYVNPEGDDSNDGLTANTPFKSITKATNVIFTDANNPHTIFLAQGVYSPELTGECFPINLPSYLTIKSSSNPSLEATSETSMLYISNAEDIQLSGFTLTNCRTAISVHNSKIELENLKICESSSTAVLGYNSNLTLANCKIYNNSGDMGSAITAKNSSNLKISNCDIYNNISQSKGAVYLENSALQLSGGSIKNNTSESLGGGLTCSNSVLSFSPIDPPSIYANSATLGQDIYLVQLQETCYAYLDTFTVMHPIDIFAYPSSDIQFNINHSFGQEVDYNSEEIIITPHIVGNFPNPFYSSGRSHSAGTNIKFQLYEKRILSAELNTQNSSDRGASDEFYSGDDVRIEIYNIKGQKIKSIHVESAEIERSQTGKIYSVNWNGRDKSSNFVSSGVYLYDLKIGGRRVDLKKMLILK